MKKVEVELIGPPKYRVDKLPKRDTRWVERTVEFDYELGMKMLDDMRRGQDPVVVATKNGVPVHTFRTWLEWGAEGREPYASFTRRVLQCRSEVECELVDVLYAAAKTDPVWAQKFLEKIAPTRWSEKAKKEITVKTEFRLKKEQEVNNLLEADSSVLDVIMDDDD
jgi:hypothetical protein